MIGNSLNEQNWVASLTLISLNSPHHLSQGSCSRSAGPSHYCPRMTEQRSCTKPPAVIHTVYSTLHHWDIKFLYEYCSFEFSPNYSHNFQANSISTSFRIHDYHFYIMLQWFLHYVKATANTIYPGFSLPQPQQNKKAVIMKKQWK